MKLVSVKHIYRCGDVFSFYLQEEKQFLQPYLRTNIGGGHLIRRARVESVENGRPTPSNSWVDHLMECEGKGKYVIHLPLTEVGYFEAKVWFKDKNTGERIWKPGENIYLKVEPASTLLNNSIYGVFTRLFGANKHKNTLEQEQSESVKVLEEKGYTVTPASGTFRDVINNLDHIMGDMGFRILQLLPIFPVPTSYGRMGHMGSPYAALDFFSVDPALAEFDRRVTPMNQFMELIEEVHRRRGEVFLDIPVDHTGWASVLQQEHPDFFEQSPDGEFVSPGAWGVVWEDLVKLDFANREVWKKMGEVFLFWCKRGIDGFRCDAGYMIPFQAWQYIICKVREQFPDTVFLLEGLGGPPKVTANLLSKGTFSWAYSELFQNYSKEELVSYTQAMIKTNQNCGGLCNFSETHDNDRLAKVSLIWSRMRNCLCALTAHAGGFGISNGVEFFAKEKIKVHGLTGLNWGNEENMLALMKKLTTLFLIHPAFFADATMELLPCEHPEIFGFRRIASNGDEVLIYTNLNCTQAVHLSDSDRHCPKGSDSLTDLISGQKYSFPLSLEAGQAVCLDVKGTYWDELTNYETGVISKEQEKQFLKACAMDIYVHAKGRVPVMSDWEAKYLQILKSDPYRYCMELGFSSGNVVSWDVDSDFNRRVMISGKSVLWIQSKTYFTYKIEQEESTYACGKASQTEDGNYFSLVKITDYQGEEESCLNIKVCVDTKGRMNCLEGKLVLLSSRIKETIRQYHTIKEVQQYNSYALCANNRGSMAQVSGVWADYRSKYDGFFIVNLDPKVPKDRTTLLSRWRCWVVVEDFSHELGLKAQKGFASDGALQACWYFKVPVGAGYFSFLTVSLCWHAEKNKAQLHISRDAKEGVTCLDKDIPIKVILRPDIEYRINHELTKAYTGADNLFPQGLKTHANGFSFDPYKQGTFDVSGKDANFTYEPEWQYMQELPVEKQRGLDAYNDLFSPGFFSVSLKEGESTYLDMSTEKGDEEIVVHEISDEVDMKQLLERSIRQFIIKRDQGKTVIAGYPWFLDWGRDTLICLRGIIAAGMMEEAKSIILTFAQYEEKGTLPNMIHGENASNRETSDAPLWFIVLVKEFEEKFPQERLLDCEVKTRKISDVIKSILLHYKKGTPHGIRMDETSGLIYSPSHFTWMDTNYPAGTPREGYPIEIQALWYIGVGFGAKINGEETLWEELQQKILSGILKYFDLKDKNGFADCLHCKGFKPASEAVADDACRPNQLFLISLDVLSEKSHREDILRATQSLLVPGGIRSLKDEELSFPLPVYANGGGLLNDPKYPYWGSYGGDEDTRRKPAYHNGTAWAWLFPSYVEGLLLLSGNPELAKALLMSAKTNIEQGIVNYLPEIYDGDSPHTQRGCLAQAWSVTEFYRVYQLIKNF